MRVGGIQQFTRSEKSVPDSALREAKVAGYTMSGEKIREMTSMNEFVAHRAAMTLMNDSFRNWSKK